MTEFAARVDAFLDEFFRLHPVAATSIGNHDHDGEWGELGEAGRKARLEFVARWASELATMAPEALSPDDRIDRQMLLSELAAYEFDETELREDAWDPLGYVYMIGGGIFPLLARDFAALSVRLASTAGRLEGVPAVLAAARTELGSLADRPPSRLHTEMAAKQLPGIASLAADAVAQAEAAGASDGAVTPLLPRLRAAAAGATRAIQEFGKYLDGELLPRSSGEGRLGADVFARKLRHTFRTDITAEQITARANVEFPAVRAEMIRIARAIWDQWRPGEPLPTATSEGSQEAADQKTVAAVTEAIGKAHHKAPELVEYCRESYRGIVDFIRRRDLITVPDEPLEIDWTPPFLREFAGAMLDSPGPLDKGQKTFYFVTPPPKDWGPEQIESYLAEENDRQIDLTTIHEGSPGHYLQLVYSNRCPSKVRAVFGSGVFIEGWAVYVTQVMMDAGFKADDPALMLIHWKFYLRAIANAMIDVGIHAGSMTEDEALDLMIRGGFQEESEARKKWDRARLTSTQLSTYFVGSMGMWDLERDVRVRAAVAAGAGEGAVPAPRVVGGFGPTPGFSYKAHLESVIAHGSPPMPLIRKILLGE
jgi:uncharacterized protein (DUF885 family)